MLFSGVAQSYHCPGCDINYSNTLPTSILPILVVILGGTAIWSHALEPFLGVGGLVYLLTVLLSVFSFFGFYILLEQLCAPWTSTLTCPECKKTLEAVGAGFINAGLPTGKELLLYLLTLALPALSLLFRL